MKANPIVLYGQIPGYEHLIESGVKFKNLYSSFINSSIEKFTAELLISSDNLTRLRFSLPENALSFSADALSRFSGEPKIPYKIGIAVDYDNENNSSEFDLALHLSEISPEGSVLLTKDALNSIEEKSGFDFHYVGSTFVKGLNDSVEIFALSGKGIYVPSLNELTKQAKKRNSIAVLAFHNTSSEKELDYICEGLAEEIIDSLTKSEDLFVTARSSSFLFKNQELPISDISKKLNVSFILDGSIRKRNNLYRISYQLVDCATGYNVASDTIEASFDNLYDTEREISSSVLHYFHPEEPLEKKVTSDYYIDPNAYSYYLRGKYYSLQWEVAKVKQAIQHFKKALEIVPNYSLAHAGLSMTYTHMALNGFDDFRESIRRAVEFADLAISEDSSQPDGFISKAVASFWLGNWYVPDFESNITSALALSPCNAEIRMFNGMLFLMKGELRRSLSELLLAKELDPYSQGVNIRLGLVQYLTREYEDAYNTFLYLLNTDQNKTYNILRIAWCCIQLKQYKKALEFLDESVKNYEYYNMIYGTYLVIYHGLKDDLKFFEYKDLIEKLPEADVSTSYNMAILHKILGNKEKSIQYLQRILQHPLFLFTFMQYDEYWEDYHDDPQFQEVVTSRYKGTGNQLLTINSETKENMELRISDFLYAEAQDNYTLVAFREKGKKGERILRATLSFIENQLNNTEIIRCHRSYLVNATAGFHFHKSDNRAILRHAELKIEIPVSRSKEKEIKEQIGSGSTD